MGDSDTVKLVLRIERGCASDEELAAVTVVLCSLLPGQGEESGYEQARDVPPWRPERAGAAYRSPYGWR